ncbi:T3SS effector HopA1 family protein [Nocardia wallacei]|uniref:T3SS effector HopA1 family protein n=1 Tax=Nocardia wallacei TaxID=480035 RepID=UPI00245427B0|nr:T3SS effector HopA1 family protein [Nocardia wallacei]
MTKHSGFAIAEVLRGLLGRTECSENTVIIDFHGTELTGSADVVRDKLAVVLYQVLHARSRDVVAPVPSGSARPAALPKKPGNGSRVERELVKLFREREFVVNRPLVAKTDDTVIYRQGGILMRTTRDRVVRSGASDVDVRVRHYSNAVSPGFFYVYGSCSLEEKSLRQKNTRVYLSVGDPDASVRVFTELVAKLDDCGADFDTKILSHPDDYPRSDSIVVYTDREPEEICAAIDRWTRDHRHHFVDGSLLTRTWRRGISTADEPVTNRTGALSFGQHRSAMIADALIDHATTGRDLEDALERSARSSGVNPRDFSRNLTEDAA